MGQLPSFTFFSQTPYLNGCWIACSAMVLYYYTQKSEHEFDSIIDFLRNNRAKYPEFDPSGRGCPTKLMALFTLGTMGTDSWAIPTSNDIIDQIDRGFPLISCVGKRATKSARKDKERGYIADPHYSQPDSHYVVICGYEHDARGNLILSVADPAYDGVQEVKYNSGFYTCRKGFYWQHTSYTDRLKVAEQLVLDV